MTCDESVYTSVRQVHQTVQKLDNATGTLISLMVYSIRSSLIYACVFITRSEVKPYGYRPRGGGYFQKRVYSFKAPGHMFDSGFFF